jgi:uncharacterized membrane protein
MTSTFSETGLPNESSRLSFSRLRWVPFVIMLLAVVILALNWGRIPDRWVTHWNLRGEADGWSNKSVAGVMLPFFIGVAVCAFLELIATWIAAIRSFGDSYKGKPEAAAVIAAATAGMIRLVSISISLVLSIVAIQLPLYPLSSPTFFIAIVVSSIILAVITGLRRITSAYRALKHAGMMEGMEGFNGLIYSNANDPNLWVPKPLGYGYTINFAHRWGWPIFLAILGIPFLVVLVIIVLSMK